MDRIVRDNIGAIAVISTGTAQSGAVPIGLHEKLAFVIEAVAWTPADITFLASADGVNFYPVYDDTATEVKIAAAGVAISKFYVAGAILAKLAGLRWIKFRSGVAGADVAQAQDVVFKIALKA